MSARTDSGADTPNSNEPSTPTSGARPVLVGRVIAVCAGPGGIPKHPVASARVGLSGLEGDGHRFRFHGGPNRAVCLFSIEDYRALQRDGVDCTPPGAFGENVLTEGLDFRALRADDELVIGDEALVSRDDALVPGNEALVSGDGVRSSGDVSRGVGGPEIPTDAGTTSSAPTRADLVRIAIHDVREPCKTLKSVDARFPNLMLGRSGFVCRVIQGGELRAGDVIRRM